MLWITGSTWHVIEYNATTGAVIQKRTGQGSSNDRYNVPGCVLILPDCFSKVPGRVAKHGQFTVLRTVCLMGSTSPAQLIWCSKVYYHTRDRNYLLTARRLAAYFLDNLPDDYVVPWYVFLMWVHLLFHWFESC